MSIQNTYSKEDQVRYHYNLGFTGKEVKAMQRKCEQLEIASVYELIFESIRQFTEIEFRPRKSNGKERRP